jgi:hypothetical protein
MREHRLAACGALVLAFSLLLLEGCGGGEDRNEEPLTMRQLAGSVEGKSAAFLDREGTALHRSLERFLGGRITTKVARGSAECRSGKRTASISNSKKYPFACIVEGSADGNGLTVNIALGFVGMKLEGRCWRAANERISVTSGAPALLTRREAMRPLNQIAACG